METQVKSPAALYKQELVSGKELAATLNEYANSGSTLSFRTMSSILDRNPDISPADLAGVLPACLRGIRNQCGRNFPADAKEWKRLAYDIGERVNKAGDPAATAEAQSSLVELQAVFFNAGRAIAGEPDVFPEI